MSTILRNASYPLSSWYREIPPTYLTPILSRTSHLSSQMLPFSTSTAYHQRKRRRDNNPNRGVSALRRTYFRKPLSITHIVKREGLPQPVLDPKRRRKVEVDPDHGLYGFFNTERQLLTKPDQENQHGWCNDVLRTTIGLTVLCREGLDPSRAPA